MDHLTLFESQLSPKGARYTPLVLNFAASGARFAKSATDQFVDGTLEIGFAL